MKAAIEILENIEGNLKQELWWSQDDKEKEFIEIIPMLKKRIKEIQEALILLKKTDVCEGCESPSILKYCEDCYHEACGMK